MEGRMKVLVGGPVHDRPQTRVWLRHLAHLEHGWNQYAFHFILDACYPKDLEPEWSLVAKRAGWEFACVEAEERHYDRSEPGKQDAYRHLARLRNLMRERLLRDGFDAMLTIDTDIVAPPDLLVRLANGGHDRPWVAALVQNRPGDERTWNVFRMARSRQDGRPGLRHFQATGQGPDGTTWPGPEGCGHDPQEPGIGEPLVSGAVCLYRRDLLERVGFQPHPCGEDVGFGAQAIREGFSAWYLPIVCEHLMDEQLLKEHLERCNVCRSQPAM
jgi:hypothetical protein